MQLVLDLLVPGIIAGVSCYGMAKRVDVYDALLQGAAKGLEILLRILPALVTLLTVVAMLRASGALELAAELLAPALEWLGIPPETVGLMLVRPISGSAALGVGLLIELLAGGIECLLELFCGRFYCLSILTGECRLYLGER